MNSGTFSTTMAGYRCTSVAAITANAVARSIAPASAMSRSLAAGGRFLPPARACHTHDGDAHRMDVEGKTRKSVSDRFAV